MATSATEKKLTPFDKIKAAEPTVLQSEYAEWLAGKGVKVSAKNVQLVTGLLRVFKKEEGKELADKIRAERAAAKAARLADREARADEIAAAKAEREQRKAERAAKRAEREAGREEREAAKAERIAQKEQRAADREVRKAAIAARREERLAKRKEREAKGGAARASKKTPPKPKRATKVTSAKKSASKPAPDVTSDDAPF